MNQKEKEIISQFYKILLLYEDACSSQSSITEKDYLRYLNRIYIYWLGADREKIYNILRGLYLLGLSAEHETVKSMVFHIIDLIEKEGENYVI